MPLNPRKLAHLAANRTRIFASRAEPITFTIRNPNNSTSTLTINAIFRSMADEDPSTVRAPPLSDIHGADAILEANLSDISLTQLRATITLARAPGAAGATFASTFMITSIAVKGIPPGGDRWIVTLTRQR